MKPISLNPKSKIPTYAPNAGSPAPTGRLVPPLGGQSLLTDAPTASTNSSVHLPYVHMAQPYEVRERAGELAELTHSRWSSKDGGASKAFYRRQLKERLSHASTPIFYVEDQGVIQGAIYPLRTSLEPVSWKTWDQLTDSGLWTTDSPTGHLLVCPQIVVRENTPVKHIPRALIAGGVLAYADNEFNRGFGSIKDLHAYSRPAEFGYWHAQFAHAGKKLTIGDYLKMSVDLKAKGLPTVKELLDSARQFMRYFNSLRVKPDYVFEAMTDFLRITGRKHIDTNLRMHTSFGGRMARFYENACPLDAQAGGYAVQVRYGHQLHK